MNHLAAFMGVSLVIITTPGTDTALTIRNTLLGGRRSGLYTSVGVACGLLVWALCTAAGLSQLIRASQPGFLALRIVGATYVINLGGRALVDAFHGRHAERDARTARTTERGSLRQGLLSNLGNPKMVVFFVSLLPPFAGTAPSFASLFVLGAIFAALTLVWLAGYACIVARLGDILRRSMIRRALDAICGTVLVALGLRLASEA